MTHFHVNARRWFQPTYGNTYHTVALTTDGPTHVSERTYGYGDHYLHTAGTLAVKHGYLPTDFDPYDFHTRALAELGHTLTIDVADVTRKRDLHRVRVDS